MGTDILKSHYARIASGLAGGEMALELPSFLDCYPNTIEAERSPFRVGELLPWKTMWLRVEDVGKNWLKLGVTGRTRA